MLGFDLNNGRSLAPAGGVDAGCDGCPTGEQTDGSPVLSDAVVVDVSNEEVSMSCQSDSEWCKNRAEYSDSYRHTKAR